MRITLSSVFVDDQAKAQKFYTEVLGFVTKVDMPMGGGARWLTVVSKDDPEGVQLLLEPNQHPAATTFQKAIFADGIPATSFATLDIQKDFERMSALGVVFRQKPTPAGPVLTALFEDTCGNLISMHQML
ncbi:glyoxalase/bleomycin resistance protein/dioxygenase [Myxococcus stipitatus DSM 14675]|uniref:Glyoxalase/bleomycin resistance protein/dioxygenase n=1 Tax=Myxococcus stipitatus (strain DSM 14675 / JCM 12634 / Mx s8) TaxID=1278073 RepID=L7U953_MYXSD|nr:VOC family protein [Myxococcus stipitatus]AGC44633.1 glyoxalase/bleomycin resistance protein/dioxygenase [Myxococcus stipitatus DSM 14675]